MNSLVFMEGTCQERVVDYVLSLRRLARQPLQPPEVRLFGCNPDATDAFLDIPQVRLEGRVSTVFDGRIASCWEWVEIKYRSVCEQRPRVPTMGDNVFDDDARPRERLEVTPIRKYKDTFGPFAPRDYRRSSS